MGAKTGATYQQIQNYERGAFGPAEQVCARPWSLESRDILAPGSIPGADRPVSVRLRPGLGHQAKRLPPRDDPKENLKFSLGVLINTMLQLKIDVQKVAACNGRKWEKTMEMPRFFKPGAWGAVVGAIATVAIGFAWGGWVTQTTASRMARDGADAAAVQALVPICVAQSRQDPDSKQKFEQLGAASTWSRDDLLAKTGWATVPGTDAPNRGLATACLKKLAIPS